MSHFRFMNQSKRLTSQSIWKITNFGKCTCSDQLLSSFSLLEFLFLFFFLSCSIGLIMPLMKVRVMNWSTGETARNKYEDFGELRMI